MKLLTPTEKSLANLGSNDLLTTAQIAKMLGITYPTARRIVAENFKTTQIGFGKTTPNYVRAADFVAWLESKGISPASVGVAPARKTRRKTTPAAVDNEPTEPQTFEALADFINERADNEPTPPSETPTEPPAPAIVKTITPRNSELQQAADLMHRWAAMPQKIKRKTKAELAAANASTPKSTVDKTTETTADFETETGRAYRALKKQVLAELEKNPNYQDAPPHAKKILFENYFQQAIAKANL